MSVRNLEALFRPASIAVIGASDRPGSVGVDGERAWQHVESLPGTPDLAVICTPAPTVPGLVEELGRKGVRAAVVPSAGLKQVPAPGGAGLEQQMLAAAKPYLLRILGMAVLARYAGFELEQNEDSVTMRLVLHDGL